MVGAQPGLTIKLFFRYYIVEWDEPEGPLSVLHAEDLDRNCPGREVMVKGKFGTGKKKMFPCKALLFGSKLIEKYLYMDCVSTRAYGRSLNSPTLGGCVRIL